MPRIDGFAEARKLLEGMSPQEQSKILETIANNDPELADKLQKAMVTFEDLKYLTPEMMRVLLQGVTPEDLGLALKVASKELVEHMLNLVSKNNEKDIKDVLNGRPQQISKVNEAQEKIMEFVREKIKVGQIVIDKSGSETLV